MKSELKKPKLLVTVMKTHFVFFLIFFPLIRPISAYDNLAKNPSMEGNFIFQDPIGKVAENWTGWYRCKDVYCYEGYFYDNEGFLPTLANTAHEGSKSQLIFWPFAFMDVGYNGIYQQIDNLQAGKLYHASFWFKIWQRGAALGRDWSCNFLGGIGADPNGGTDPWAVTNWSLHEEHVWHYYYAYPDDRQVSPWCKVGVWFSPNGNAATIFIRAAGLGWAQAEWWDSTWQEFRCCEPSDWHLHCYIDDVVVESVEIGTSSTVEAISPISANGVGFSQVTITLVNASGIPLTGIPASKITVHCTGSGNTITGPDAPTNANGQTTASITSTVAETKTVSVTVFGTLLADTAVVEFTGGPFGPIWYVDADAIGADEGSNWADAFNHLQDALFAAQIGHEIHVAEGSYKPDRGLWVEPGRRQASFQLISGVTIKGGYAGFGEPNPDARDVNLYKSILSGDLNGNDGPNFANNAENSYHVLVTGSGNDETAVLDGFNITAGNANGTSDPNDEHGGGLFNEINSSPTIINCTFFANSGFKYGGGMTSDVNSSPTVTNCTFSSNSAEFSGGMHIDVNSSSIVINCTFTDNRARSDGGGLFIYQGNPYLVNCTFTGNSAGDGGGMFNYSSSPTLTNCSFIGNSAIHTWGTGGVVNYHSSPTLMNCTFAGNSADYGGGIGNDHSSPTLTNCTFSGNSAKGDGGGVCNYESSSTISNCILWGNTASNGPQIALDSNSTATISYCDLQGGQMEVYDDGTGTINWGSGNIDADPCFVDPGHWDDNGTPNDPEDDLWVDGDYHLQAASPCIDAGDNTAVPPDAYDIDGDGNKTEPIPLDLDGKPRFSDVLDTVDTGNGTPPIVDMGAYEFIAGSGTAYHPADTDNDYVIGDFELLDYIDLWAQGQVGDFDLLDTIDLWAAGHYYWDESEQKFKPGVEP